MPRKHTSTTFYCFSPPVMIATCIVELSLVIYTIWRYKFNPFARLVVVLLIVLATFQLAEFHVCTGTSALVQWSHFGYMAITLLPAVSVHAISLLRHKKKVGRSPIVWATYASAAAFVFYFALTANSLEGHACLGNYIMFRVNPGLTWLYAVYYYGWVAMGIWLSVKYSREVKVKRQRQAFYGFAFGYAAFLVPTATVNLINRSTMNGIPSIMCGFAVLFALILTLYVMPRVGTERR